MATTTEIRDSSVISAEGSPFARPVPSREPDQHALDQVIDSASRNELILLGGVGMTNALIEGRVPAASSWPGLVENGFDHAVKIGTMTAAQKNAWAPQRASPDIDEYLGAAEFMGRKLDAPYGDLYARWLKGVFEDLVPTNKPMMEAIKALHSRGVPICTLNYDFLLEKTLGVPAIRLTDKMATNQWLRRKDPGILHLHGTWDEAASCIVGIRDYQSTLNDAMRDQIQRCMGSQHMLLCVGCGETFKDPNFSALIVWLKVNMKAATPQHYALVSFDSVEDRHKDPAWRGFVEPLAYGARHSDLPGFILNQIVPRLPRNRRRTKGRP